MPEAPTSLGEVAKRVDARIDEVLSTEIARWSEVDPALWRRLQLAGIPRARYRGNHVEVDKTRQVLFEVRGGRVSLVVPVSTGATGNTPLGLWHVYSRVAGWSWVLWYPT